MRQQTQNHLYSKVSNIGKTGSSGLPGLTINEPGSGPADAIDEIEDPFKSGNMNADNPNAYRRMKAAYDSWTETEHNYHQALTKLIAEIPQSSKDSLKDALEASERAWMNLYGKESTLIRKIYEQHGGSAAKTAQMYDLMTLMKARAEALKRRIEILKDAD